MPKRAQNISENCIWFIPHPRAAQIFSLGFRFRISHLESLVKQQAYALVTTRLAEEPVGHGAVGLE
jgi:hypothetical protein